ncbi:MAG: OmpA family protein [Burkholderiales bacterium]|nr:OmpA family protein [Burkholderiales bacterium]
MKRRCTAALGGAASLAAALLAGCASPPPPAPPSPPPPPRYTDTVILLPEAGGRDTAVTMRQGDAVITLAQPFAGAQAGSGAAPRSFESSAAEVRDKFGAALAAQPPRPTSFTLYFVLGSDTLTEESRAVVERVFAEIAGRPVPDVVVVGHTDTVGSGASNDALSLTRAESIARELVRRGIAPANVRASGRGERELLVPTADNVAEPRNRRVEIIVR